MKIIETELEGVLILEPNVFYDNRGWFMESYSNQELKKYGIDINFIQDNHSFSAHKHTIRGIHFQKEPKAQTKLVRCTSGSILDIAVDLRRKSPTYLEYVIVELSSRNKKQLLIPKGFGHAFITLEENTEVQYKVDEFYSQEADRTIFYGDPDIGIKWNCFNPFLSKKDQEAPYLKTLIDRGDL